MEKKLNEEVLAFQYSGIWKGGYYEGNVLDPMARSGYGVLSYISILHAVYLVTVKPYINRNTVALEIGCGRGTFSKTMTGARELVCLDALPAEHNSFWECVGKHDHVNYLQVSDFECRDLPDAHFNYLFSFGALCHISFEGVPAYLRNLYPKLVSGAECFIMISDYEKYNKAMDNLRQLSFVERFSVNPLFNLYKKYYRWKYREEFAFRMNPGEKTNISPGRWFHHGLDRTCQLLEESGYTIVNPDIGLVQRDPIVHFRKG